MKRNKFSPEILQNIKDSVNLLEVVGEHVVLRKSGANFSGLCPFHSERTPSFSVSESKQLYHCYGCKRGGDLLTFTMEILGISFPEAIEELADRARIALPKEFGIPSLDSQTDPSLRKKQAEFRAKQALAFKLNRFTAAFYHQTLKNDEKAKKYLSSRGVHGELIQSFYLGSAPDSWDALASYLMSKKAPQALAVELGLIRASQRKTHSQSSGFYDLFRKRTLFPILNLSGKVAGFGGRVMDSEEGPKYLNSPESIVFQKSKLVFGLFQAQKHIREKDEIILVEGYFDVLAMVAAGFKNVVATCGTSITPDHLNLFKRFASRMILLFDGDQAGMMATERAMELGLEQGIVLYGAEIPSGLDPDEMVFDSTAREYTTEGVSRLTDLLKNSAPLLDTKLERMMKSNHEISSEERAQALKKAGSWLGKFKDPIGREIRVEWVQKRLGVPRQLVYDSMGALRQTQGLKFHKQSKAPSLLTEREKKLSTLSSGDRLLLSGIASGGIYPKLLMDVKSKLPPGMDLHHLFEYPPAREFVEELLSHQHQWNEKLSPIPENLLTADLDVQLRTILTEALLSADPVVKPEAFRLALFRSLSRNWARFSQRIKLAISDAEGKKDVELQSQLMKEYLDVQRKMKDFNNFYDEE